MTIKLIYQGKLLQDEKHLKELSKLSNVTILSDFKVNPYIHASILKHQVDSNANPDNEAGIRNEAVGGL